MSKNIKAYGPQDDLQDLVAINERRAAAMKRAMGWYQQEILQASLVDAEFDECNAADLGIRYNIASEYVLQEIKQARGDRIP